MLKLYFKVVEDQTLYTKEDQRKRYEGLPTLLHRTVQFYTPRLTPLIKEYQTRLISSPTNHDIRSQENPEKKKNNKAPGRDNLASDIMTIGGKESVKQITTVFDQILETKKIPVEWEEAKMIILHKKETRDT